MNLDVHLAPCETGMTNHAARSTGGDVDNVDDVGCVGDLGALRQQYLTVPGKADPR